MQETQGRRIGQPVDLGHQAIQQGQEAIGPIDEAGQLGAPIEPHSGSAFDEQALDAASAIGRRQIGQGQEVAALEVIAGLDKGGLALLVDQGRDRIGKGADRIGLGLITPRLDKQRPTRAQATQGAVEPGGDGGDLPVRGRIQVRPAKLGGALEGPVLVQHHAGRDQGRPRQIVGQMGGPAAVFAEIEHGSDLQIGGEPDVPAAHIEDLRVTSSGPDGQAMTDQPDGEAEDP